VVLVAAFAAVFGRADAGVADNAFALNGPPIVIGKGIQKTIKATAQATQVLPENELGQVEDPAIQSVEFTALPNATSALSVGTVKNARLLSATREQLSRSAAPLDLVAGLAAFTLTTSGVPATKTPQPLISINFAADGGGTTAVMPPDVQIAAGSRFVLEATSETVAVLPRVAGAKVPGKAIFFRLAAAKDDPASGIFKTLNGSMLVDPSVVYDRSDGRWWIIALENNPGAGGSRLDLAVSAHDDPFDWTIHTLSYDGPLSIDSILHDQPKLALSADKVVLTWTDQSGTDPDGGAIAVAAKNAFTSATAESTAQRSSPDQCFEAPTPARNGLLTSTELFIVAAFRPQTPGCLSSSVAAPAPGSANAVAVVRIDGPTTALTTSSFVLPTADFSAAPPSAQLQGPEEVFSNDTRIQSAFVQGNRLVAASTTACVLDAVHPDRIRACLHLFDITTATGEPTLLNERAIGLPDRDLLYPSLVLDGNGHLFAVLIQTARERFIGAAVLAEGTLAKDGQVIVFGEGGAPFPCPSHDGKIHLGDYSSADRDPNNLMMFWIAAQVGPKTANATAPKPGCPASTRTLLGIATVR